MVSRGVKLLLDRWVTGPRPWAVSTAGLIPMLDQELTKVQGAATANGPPPGSSLACTIGLKRFGDAAHESGERVQPELTEAVTSDGPACDDGGAGAGAGARATGWSRGTWGPFRAEAGTEVQNSDAGRHWCCWRLNTSSPNTWIRNWRSPSAP
ncbi:uncharacterized protein LOC117796502 isoform X2 [Ailuropoda melanoleuca]|uniref:uncharacterized protein LOC117796502 isoform X2 n=1 Tax=Ailuropoda melanoleuca TaxID=9646 RepID=UPI001494EAA5|nr:uncharacterized protein LOC117796502 isoform X2 [Ailuropoda melanoleuca]